ncbi:MAG: hypothetical protein N2C14_34150 [Planctomycetales bacterium]
MKDGAASGGARATYLANRGVGWGLVSADGWRVPYRGSDCVVYHEGCGHTVGLPHPQTGNGSVMSLGQYRGWLSESWLDKDQKSRLGWEPLELKSNKNVELFSRFRALPMPPIPAPNQTVKIVCDWPEDAAVHSLRLRFQTSIRGPWVEVVPTWKGNAPKTLELGKFDRDTPVSYRIDVELKDGATAELWGYFQVRSDPKKSPAPYSFSPDLTVRDGETNVEPQPRSEVDLLALADPEKCWTSGRWKMDARRLVSPKAFGSRLELPYTPPEEYRLTAIVEPLDAPNGLILGQRSGTHRFVTLFNHLPGKEGLTAIENIDGQNVGNETTFTGTLFQKSRLSQLIVTVRKESVMVSVDGRQVVSWRGKQSRLSLSDYWKTPQSDRAVRWGIRLPIPISSPELRTDLGRRRPPPRKVVAWRSEGRCLKRSVRA